MKIVEKDNEITLRDVPLENWARGILLLFGFLIFGVGSLGLSAGRSSPPPPGGPLVPLLVALFFLYWAARKLSLPAIVTRVIADEGTVEITRRRFLILKKTERIKFTAIDRFEVVRRKPDRAFLYFNVLTLRDGSQIDLESDGNAVEGTINIIPLRLNESLKSSLKKRKLPAKDTK